MSSPRRRARHAASLVFLVGLAVVPTTSAEEARIPGRLTTTQDQALYGEAILRAAPEPGAPAVQALVPGARVVVYPDTSPPGWWFVEMQLAEGGPAVAGYVPRDQVLSTKGPFQDVPGDHWAAPAIHRLKTGGELTGQEDGRFEGERALTRYELAVLLDRAIGRLQETRAEVDRRIAELPARIAEAAERVKELDHLVPQLEALRTEEASLRTALAAVQEQATRQGVRLESMDGELLQLIQKDRDQDRRVEELLQANAAAAAELEAVRGRHGTVDPEAELQASLGETVARIERLALAARVIEDQVEEAEAMRARM